MQKSRHGASGVWVVHFCVKSRLKTARALRVRAWLTCQGSQAKNYNIGDGDRDSELINLCRASTQNDKIKPIAL